MKIIRYIIYSILSLLGILAFVIWFIYLGYQRTVGVRQGQMVVSLKPGELGQWVNPFIGTGGFPTYTSADDIPGATVPFGMVRLSPDTQFFLDPLWAEGHVISTAGYYYGDHKIMGFSHTRMIGTGAFEGGHFRVVPGSGERSQSDYLKGVYNEFSHNEEVAFPGYYAVRFPKKRILAELTASARVGLHRYTFSGKEDPHILIDVSSSLGKGKSTEGEVQINPEKQEVVGGHTHFWLFCGKIRGGKRSILPHSLTSRLVDSVFGQEISPSQIILQFRGISWVQI